MGLGRRLRRQLKREALEQVDEKQLLLVRLGQKDAQLFQMELNYNAAVQEINRLTAELAKIAPVEKEELKTDGAKIVETEELSDSEVDQASEG